VPGGKSADLQQTPPNGRSAPGWMRTAFRCRPVPTCSHLVSYVATVSWRTVCNTSGCDWIRTPITRVPGTRDRTRNQARRYLGCGSLAWAGLLPNTPGRDVPNWPKMPERLKSCSLVNHAPTTRTISPYSCGGGSVARLPEEPKTRQRRARSGARGQGTG